MGHFSIITLITLFFITITTSSIQYSTQYPSHQYIKQNISRQIEFVQNPSTLISPLSNQLRDDGSIQVFSHPWSLKDEFLSLDCVIRSDRLFPNDSLYIYFSPETNASLSSELITDNNNNNIHNNYLYQLPQSSNLVVQEENNKQQQDQYISDFIDRSECPDGTIITPFNRVIITPFIDRENSGLNYEIPVSPCGTKVDQFYINWPQQITSTTDNWVNFRFYTPPNARVTWSHFRISAVFRPYEQSIQLHGATTVASRAALARDIQLHTEFTNQQDSRQSRSQFYIVFHQLYYDISSIDLGLHGNHQFTGTFRTCTINGTSVTHATFLDLTYNLTINLMDGNSYILHCPDAYIQTRRPKQFEEPTVLNVVGQIPTILSSQKFPSRAVLLEKLQLTPVPDYVTFWVILVIMFIIAFICSMYIIKFWDDSEQDVIVLQTSL